MPKAFSLASWNVEHFKGEKILALLESLFFWEVRPDIDVRGWPVLATKNKQGEWIKKYSDHGLVYMVVEKV